MFVAHLKEKSMSLGLIMRNAINRLLGVLFYPFGGLEYYQKDYLEDYYQLLWQPKLDNNEFWISREKKRMYTDIHSKIKNYCDVHSYDEICLLFDKYYINKLVKSQNENSNAVSKLYLSYLSATAKAFISQRDGKVVYKYWENDGDKGLLGGFAGEEKILLFHALTKRVPIDMFVIQFMILTEKHKSTDSIYFLENYYEQIDIADLQLDQILEKGVSENHLHLGTATSYYYLWELMTQSPAILGNSKRDFVNLIHNFIERSTDKNIHEHLLLAGFLRVVMSAFLKEKQRLNGEQKHFIQYIRELAFKSKESSNVYKVINACLQGERLTRIMEGENSNSDSIEESVGFFKLLWEQGFGFSIYSNEIEIDIIKQIFGLSGRIHTTGENVLLHYSLMYMQSSGNEDNEFHKIFWQYIRMKSMFFQLWVQRNTTRGLDYFDKFYFTNGSTMNMSSNYWESIIRSQFANKYLKKIEFRTTVSNSYSDTKKWIIKFFKAYLTIIHEKYCIKHKVTGNYVAVREFPQAAIVYHLIKEKDYDEPEKCWLEHVMDMEINTNRLDYYTLQKKYEQQVVILKKIRRECPELSRYLVGLDAASGENNTPVWVFASVYESARDSKEEMLVSSNLRNNYDKVQSLRFTFHAGEEFRHILSGLRRIDEVIEYCKFHAGDRIGHGVALGLDPIAWKDMNPMVVVPRIEILDNLLWVYKLFSREFYNTSNVQFYIEKEIFFHAKEIYEEIEGITIPILLEAYENQFQAMDESRKACNSYIKNMSEDNDRSKSDKLFCEKIDESNTILWNAKKLYASRHCKKYMMKMMEPIYYKVTEQEIEIASEVQKIVRKRVSKLGIVIEVNPSSNTTITEADTLFKNQAYVLNGLVKSEDNVLICVNTDNPSSCATNISNELAYIYYGMLANGSSKEEALLWIDKIRLNGMNASFIHNHRDKEEILEEIEHIAKYLGID